MFGLYTIWTIYYIPIVLIVLFLTLCKTLRYDSFNEEHQLNVSHLKMRRMCSC